MGKYYRITEVVKLTSVSVRTLHYYDEINLLSPSHRTASGRRLYSKDDLLKLQQIVTLKFMDFPLAKIQQLLQDENFNVNESLKIQAGVLAEEASRIEMVSKLLHYLVDHFNKEKTIDWDQIIKIIEILQMSVADRQTWYAKYLSKDELHVFEELTNSRTNEYWTNYHERWALMFAEVKQNLNTDPESEIGIELAKKWQSLVDEIHADTPDLSDKLWDGYKAGIIPQEQLPYDKAIINYITKAYEKLERVSKKSE